MCEMRCEVRGEDPSGVRLAAGWWVGLFFEQSWENVVIKFATLWGRRCSGSQLNLCAAGVRPAHNSSTDERRADLSAAEANSHKFLPTCRLVSGITMKKKHVSPSPCTLGLRHLNVLAHWPSSLSFWNNLSSLRFYRSRRWNCQNNTDKQHQTDKSINISCDRNCTL